jgi:hypothetical protein
MHADMRTDGHDEANWLFLLLYANAPKNGNERWIIARNCTAVILSTSR